MTILITGTAGFIGYHLAKKLVDEGHQVIGLDAVNDYYERSLKFARLTEAGIETSEIDYNKIVISRKNSNYRFIQLQLEDMDKLKALFASENIEVVCNLAAQPGVRYSLENPMAYISSNINGFMNILECCRNYRVKHLVYASSSSVYGLNTKMPFSVHDNVDHPISLYAATKKSNELMAHVYSHLFGLPTTGLRFFTVYGPWGRPDMAPVKFARAIQHEQQIEVYNNGEMYRDFTFVDDIVNGIRLVMDHIPVKNTSWNPGNPDPASSSAPYRIFNIGNNKPVHLMEFIRAIEEALGKKANIQFMPLQAGDLLETNADINDLMQLTGYAPETSIRQGVKAFVEWFNGYYI